MSRYMWKLLLIMVLIGGGTALWNLEDFLPKEVSIFIYSILFIIFIANGFLIYLSKEEKLNNASIKRGYKSLFGPWALIAEWGYVILILLAGLSTEFLPSQPFIGILLSIGSIVFVVVCRGLVEKHMKLE